MKGNLPDAVPYSALYALSASSVTRNVEALFPLHLCASIVNRNTVPRSGYWTELDFWCFLLLEALEEALHLALFQMVEAIGILVLLRHTAMT